MKITIERDDDTTEVFQDISDLYIAFRQQRRVSTEQFPVLTTITEVKSFSWGANIRELVKELQQSLTELQDFLREQRHGDTG